jgi:hypothetical protein
MYQTARGKPGRRGKRTTLPLQSGCPTLSGKVTVQSPHCLLRALPSLIGLADPHFAIGNRMIRYFRRVWARTRVCVVGVAASASLLGCTTIFPQTAELRDSWPADLPERIELVETPFFPQLEYQCGPAALATVLASFKVPVSADDLVDQVYIPSRQGSIQIEMLAAARRYGKVSYVLAPSYADLLREVAAGTPVIVLQNYGAPPDDYWHYAVVIGYERRAGRLILRSGETKRHTMLLPLFEYTWKGSGYWAMVVVPPDRIPVTADPARYLESIITLESVGQAGAAATAYERFLERWPDQIAARIGLANAYYALGDLSRAESVLRQAVEQHPDSVIALNNLAHTLSKLDRNAEALEFIEHATARGGPHADAVAKTRDLILERLRR